MKHFALVIAAALSVTACDANTPKALDTAQPADGTKTAVTLRSSEHAPHRVTVTVTGSGYAPNTVQARAGRPLTLVFKRTTDEGCGDELVFPDRDIRRDLPLNQEVEVKLTPQVDETITFTCGMGMYRGSVVASAR